MMSFGPASVLASFSDSRGVGLAATAGVMAPAPTAIAHVAISKVPNRDLIFI